MHIPKFVRESQSLIRYKIVANGSKLDKIPLDRFGQVVDAQDKENWRNFDTVADEEFGNGIGIVLHRTIGEGQLVCLDFDKLDQRPKEEQETIEEFANYFGGWCERSCSGNGLHVFFNCVNANFENLIPSRLISKFLGNFEFYYQKRFIALTFNSSSDWQADLPVLSLPEIFEIVGVEVFEKEESRISTNFKACPKNFSDSDILKNVSIGSQEDKSEAVYQTIIRIATYSSSPEQVLRVFNRTPLAVGKYDPLGQNKQARIVPKYILPTIGQILEKERSKLGLFMGFSKEEEIKENQEESDEYKYVTLLIQTFSKPKRCLVTDNMYVTDSLGRTMNCDSTDVLNTLKEAARLQNDKEGRKGLDKFRSTEIESALAYHKVKRLRPELLLQIETWDGRDRFKEFSECLKFTDVDCTAPMFEYFLKEWFVASVNKIFNHGQNRVFVLQGGQGIGKDTFFDALLNGWGDYRIDVSAPSKHAGEEALMEQLYGKVIVNMPELDRFDPVRLKNYVTANTFAFRQKYGRSVGIYKNRCSFVASCNPTNIFKDSTGNRRFVLFRLKGGRGEAIRWEYPNTELDSKQLISQAFTLWKNNKERPLDRVEKYERIMSALIGTLTPQDRESEIIEGFESWLNENGLTHVEQSHSGIKNWIAEQIKDYGFSRREIEQALSNRGMRRKVSVLKGKVFLGYKHVVEDTKKLEESFNIF